MVTRLAHVDAFKQRDMIIKQKQNGTGKPTKQKSML